VKYRTIWDKQPTRWAFVCVEETGFSQVLSHIPGGRLDILFTVLAGHRHRRAEDHPQEYILFQAEFGSHGNGSTSERTNLRSGLATGRTLVDIWRPRRRVVLSSPDGSILAP
jgi:hypothetical protein